MATDFSLLPILAGVIGLYIVYYIGSSIALGASRRKFMKENGCEPAAKYPSGDPFLNYAFYKENVQLVKKHAFLPEVKKRFERMGVNTYALNVMGEHAFITIEPENIKAILATKFEDFSLGPRRKMAFLPILGHGIFTTDGAAWEHSRSMLRPNFVRSQVGDLATFETHVSNLIDTIPRDGSTVDLQDLFFRLTIDSATEFLFGTSTLCLAPGAETRSASQFANAFNYCTDAMSRHSRMGWLSKLIPEPEYKKNQSIVHHFADTYVKEVLEYHRTHDVEKLGEGDRYIFLRELVKQTQDPYQLRSELLNILLAGRDTTASLLSNLWFELAKRPNVWAKLCDEVDTLHGEKPTYQQLKDMKYLKYCLNESLRVNPVVPGNTRTANRDTVLPLGGGPGGKSPLFIPKDTIIFYSAYTMHRRVDYYGTDANEFRPERWEKLRPGWEYLPFNGGPRICIGQQFALTEAGYTTVRLMQEFKGLESRDPEEWKEWLTLTCASGNGTKVALTPF